MSRAVWKFAASLTHQAGVEMPKGATILHVEPLTDDSDAAITFWAEVDTDAVPEQRYFGIYGTGHFIPEGVTYLGTTQLPSLGLVFHLYELPHTTADYS